VAGGGDLERGRARADAADAGHGGRGAARHGLAPPNLEDLFDPELSLSLGAHELGRLYGLLEPAGAVAAAYNAARAGPGVACRVRRAVPSERYLASVSFGRHLPVRARRAGRRRELW